MTKKIQTLKGSVEIDSLDLILPHEHLFTDLRGPLVPGYAQADPAEVTRVVEPYLAEAFAAGATALVECSTIGVGRNLRVLQSLAEVSPIQIIVPTAYIGMHLSLHHSVILVRPIWQSFGYRN